MSKQLSAVARQYISALEAQASAERAVYQQSLAHIESSKVTLQSASESSSLERSNRSSKCT